MAAVAFSIFWADGTADGLWVAEKVGWTGLALVSAKSTWAASRADAGFDRPGVYVLVSSSPEFEEEVYIGEADVLRKRLNNHYANREWARVVAFTTKDGSLNKAHVKYLESPCVLSAFGGDGSRQAAALTTWDRALSDWHGQARRSCSPSSHSLSRLRIGAVDPGLAQRQGPTSGSPSLLREGDPYPGRQ